MVKGHHPQFRCLTLLLCNLDRFDKGIVVHCSVIQKEADDLLPRGATEPFTHVLVFTQICS